MAHLQKDLPKVELVEADLLKEGSFDDAVKGIVSKIFRIGRLKF